MSNPNPVCICRKAPEGVIGWDRGMISPRCPLHGHEALPRPPRFSGIELDELLAVPAVDEAVVCEAAAVGVEVWIVTRERGGSYADASVQRKRVADALRGFRKEVDDPQGCLTLADRVLDVLASEEAESL